MSYDVSRSTITVGDTTYDVEEQSTDYGNRYTISLDGEDVFDGLVGVCEMEQYDASMHNPRDWSNVGTMAVSYRGYELGDEDISKIDFECSDCNGYGEYEPDAGEGPMTKCSACGGSGHLHPVDYFKKEHGARVVLPLSVYEHSGITMFVGHEDYTFDPGGWDTSYVGFIYDTPEKVKECIGDDATDEQIKEAMIAEVKIYASYLEGDVTWYSVEDSETDYLDGCGGYVGDSDHCESECYASLETAIIQRIKEESERAYWLARDIPTV